MMLWMVLVCFVTIAALMLVLRSKTLLMSWWMRWNPLPCCVTVLVLKAGSHTKKNISSSFASLPLSLFLSRLSRSLSLSLSPLCLSFPPVSRSLCMYVSIYVSIYLSIYLSLSLSLSFFRPLSLYLSFFLKLYIYIYIYLSLSVSVSLQSSSSHSSFGCSHVVGLHVRYHLICLSLGLPALVLCFALSSKDLLVASLLSLQC